jgi:hypothetical protein
MSFARFTFQFCSTFQLLLNSTYLEKKPNLCLVPGRFQYNLLVGNDVNLLLSKRHKSRGVSRHNGKKLLAFAIFFALSRTFNKKNSKFSDVIGCQKKKFWSTGTKPKDFSIEFFFIKYLFFFIRIFLRKRFFFTTSNKI